MRTNENIQNLLEAIRITADVVSVSDDGAVTLSATTTQYAYLNDLLDEEPKILGIDPRRVKFVVQADDLQTLVDEGKTVSTSRTADYDVTRSIHYDVVIRDETVNDVSKLVWDQDERAGFVRVNDADFSIYETTAGDILDNPPNADRQLYAIDCIVENEPKILHSGSVSGLIKRLVNFGKLIAE